MFGLQVKEIKNQRKEVFVKCTEEKINARRYVIAGPRKKLVRYWWQMQIRECTVLKNGTEKFGPWENLGKLFIKRSVIK